MRGFVKDIRLVIFIAIILILSVRGIYGNPRSSELSTNTWSEEGPFELSPERGRFALVYSLIEDKSVFFSLPIARFAIPDLGYSDGKYVSLFAPGVSFVALPGYLIGKTFGVSQVGTFLVISLFALMNAILVKRIASYFGAKKLAATIACFAFLFATPAYSYAASLYQHHISTFLILLSIYFLLKKERFVKYLVIWVSFGISILVDFPNFFLFLPIIFFSIAKVFKLRFLDEKIKIRVELVRLLSVIGLVLPFVLLFWFNNLSYGSPFRLSGTVENVREIGTTGLPIRQEIEDKEISETDQEALSFFKTRNMINGLYVLLLSLDRGIIYFAPIVLFGVVGILELNKKAVIKSLLVSILVLHLTIYALWGDPWGGWAFGGRYLIPSYAILSIFIGIAVTKLRHNFLFMFMLFLTLAYSVLVNTLGTLTSNTNPPRTEAEHLSYLYHKDEKYSYDRNFDYILNKGSKSFIYGQYLEDWLSPFEFYLIVSLSLISVVSASITYLHLFGQDSEMEIVIKRESSGKNLRINLGIVEKLKALPRNIGLW